jgi:dolichol-phosphate mannosyltransferase
LLNILSSIKIPEQSGDFCLLRRKVVDELNKLPENLKHHRVLRSWVGYKQIGLTYDRPERVAGNSKYSFSQLYNLATDGLTSASTKPLKVAQFFIFINALLSFLLIIVFIFQVYSPFFNSESGIINILFFTNIFISFTSLTSTLFIYILGAYISRIYQEVKGRPHYLVDSVYESETFT